MTQADKLELLRNKVAEYGEGGQVRAAEELGYSTSAINQVLHGTYKGRIENVLKRVIEVYGGLLVDCPSTGSIPLATCAEERKKPFLMISAEYSRQRLACQKCPNNGGKP
jgi:hypothetical protein